MNAIFAFFIVLALVGCGVQFFALYKSHPLIGDEDAQEEFDNWMNLCDNAYKFSLAMFVVAGVLLVVRIITG